MKFFKCIFISNIIGFVLFPYTSANLLGKKVKEDIIIQKHSSPHLFFPKGMKSKFEYTYSLKGPKLLYAKGNNDLGIPFFNYGGYAIPEDDFIRLVPSLKGKKGFTYSKKQFNFTDGFVLNVYFQMNGKRIGGDGMGIWYVYEKNETSGPTLGGPKKWKGLAVLLDTYDNDGGENNPMVSAILNDGTKEFNTENDGKDIINEHCLRNIRNRGLPVHVKVVYAEKQLTVYVSELYEKSVSIGDLCLTVKDITLSNMGYLGLTAETGELVDDVDVFGFETFSLSRTSEPIKEMSDGVKLKFNEEFTKYLDEFEKNIKEYEQKHKDDKEFKKKQIIKDRGGKEKSDATLLQIWDYQTTIKEMLHQILEEMDKITVTSDVDSIKSSLVTVNNEMSKLTHNSDTKFSHINSKLEDMQISLAKISREVHSLTIGDSPRETPTGITIQALILTSILQVLLILGFILYKDQRNASNKKFY